MDHFFLTFVLTLCYHARKSSLLDTFSSEDWRPLGRFLYKYSEVWCDGVPGTPSHHTSLEKRDTARLRAIPFKYGEKPVDDCPKALRRQTQTPQYGLHTYKART